MRITDKGMLRLRSEYLDYKHVFENAPAIVMKGKVVTGLGEGQYYISLDGDPETGPTRKMV